MELDEIVSGTVTVSWVPSPDEKKDDRLHYMITKRDSVKRTWQVVADHLFNNKFTAINIMAGRQYKFRVYAKNDMGVSKPSESPVWEIKREKGRFINIGGRQTGWILQQLSLAATENVRQETFMKLC